MKILAQTLLLIPLIVSGFGSYAQKKTIEIRDDFKKYYEQFKVSGSFAIYDVQQNKFIFQLLYFDQYIYLFVNTIVKMNNKLTLKLNKILIERAKMYARKRHISISKLIET